MIKAQHKQQTVISANAVFCHRIFLLLISIQSLHPSYGWMVQTLVWSCSFERCLQSWPTQVRTGTLTSTWRAWQESGCTMTTRDNTPPWAPEPHWSLSSECGWALVSRDWAHPAWTLFTLRWFVTDPDIDWRNFNSIIDTKALARWTGWPLQSSPSQQKQNVTHDHEDTHDMWHEHAAIMGTRLSVNILI